MFVRLFRIKASESLKTLNRSYLKRRKVKKQGQKEPLTTWECQNYKKSSQQLPSCVIATRLAVLQKYFSHYSALSMKRRWKFFQRKSIQVKEKKKLKEKKQRRKLAFGTLILPKLAQILEQSSGARQVWLWSLFFFDHCIKQINRFHIVVDLFSNRLRSQKTSKSGRNISDTLAYGSCATSLFLPHFDDIICDLLLNKRTATWNLFVKYNHPPKGKWILVDIYLALWTDPEGVVVLVFTKSVG